MLGKFGQFTVQLVGESELVPLFPAPWYCVKSVGCETADVVLQIEKGSLICKKPVSNGWSEDDSCGKKRWIYSNSKNVLFALQTEASHHGVRVTVNESVPNSLRMGIQFGLLLALYDKCVGLHGVTMLCGNEVVILSAPSGTGKTTLGKLLERYCDAIMINGDFALLYPTADGVIFEPTPFCGSSGRCLNHCFRVNRVVFLEQSESNVWNELTGREAMKRFMSNSFVPTWDDNMQTSVQKNILKCISLIKVNSFSFAPNQEAAEMFLNQLSSNEE